MQQLLLVRPHPGHVLIEEVSAPPQTRRVRIQVKIRSRCPEANPRQQMVPYHPPRQVPSHFRGKGTGTEGGSDSGDQWPSDATAKSASEGDHEEPASRAKPGGRGSPAKAELRERPRYESSPQPSGISRLVPEMEKPCRPRYRWSCLDTLQSARARDPTSSHLSQSRGCDKARGVTGRPAWLPAPKRREPTSHPDSGEV